MGQKEKPTAAFVLSLIAGIFILINGALLGFLGSFLSNIPGFISKIPGISPLEIPVIPPEGLAGLAALLAIASTVLYVLMAVGVVFGVLVLLGAFMLHRNPSAKTAWGVIILLFSILSIVIGGGFIIGFILGIIGGALALAWKPSTSPTTPTTTST
jgi:hypothetical protein